MEHTHLVTATDLADYGKTRDSEAVIPELIWMLVNESASDLTTCRIPYGDSINQPGWDGLVEAKGGFRQFVPKNKSYWEIGTGAAPQAKATEDFGKRTKRMTSGERGEATYVFVTPHNAESGGWDEPKQSRWIKRRKKHGWGQIKILDGIQIADWLREFPAIGKWLLSKAGLVKSVTGFSTPSEHWENLRQLSLPNKDPSLPPKVFLAGREQARTELLRLFRGEIGQLLLVAESENDAEDFVSACLADLDEKTRFSCSNRCLLVRNPDAWTALANLRAPHVLVAHPSLDLEGSGEQLHMAANRRGHAVVLAVCGSWAKGSDRLIPLPSPSASVLEVTLGGCGYSRQRAKEIAAAGALSLAALKRHLRGLGDMPPYATWESARMLAQASLIGQWSGIHLADKTAIETFLGKSYGEWIETVRPETLRPDTPLRQRDEKWRVISRGEAWAALGSRVSDSDLDRLQKAILAVLGECNPELDLPPESRYAASVHGKDLKHSRAIRKGFAEALALLGSRPEALSSCSSGKAEQVARQTVRTLLTNGDWKTWASFDLHLPMFAEAAPVEFLEAVESALRNPETSPFGKLFEEEIPSLFGRNYTCGLLWALETLAWHSDYLQRVAFLLGELASINHGGKTSNRPANSLTDIFLPWYPQTCAPLSKRKAAVELLLKNRPEVGWALLMSLLPHARNTTSGCCRPTWRQFIPETWSERAVKRDYDEQAGTYADLAVGVARKDLTKLTELIDRLPNLPEQARSRVFDHLTSEDVTSLPESARLPVWEALVDLARKHRKHPNARWAMTPESVSRIEEIASALAPLSPLLTFRRLFSDRDCDLFDEKGNYEEQQKALNLRRQAAVVEMAQANGVAGLLDFARTVANPWSVGSALGQIDSMAADAAVLPSFLDRGDEVSRGVVSGFVSGRFTARSWPWVDSSLSSGWTCEQKASFLSMLPFGHEVWRRAETVLGQDASVYWGKARVLPYGEQPYLLEAVEKLILHKRPVAALVCVDRLISKKEDCPTELAVQALLDGVGDIGRVESVGPYDLVEIIKWLQANPSTDRDGLFKVEWAYLALLDHENGGAPKAIEACLSTDPAFFCRLLTVVYRSENEEPKDRQPSDEERRTAKHVYGLLQNWRTVPGMTPDGAFDPQAFSDWLKEVSGRTRASGHYGIGLDQIGKVLAHAPADPDGLWIHHAVADALNAKDADDMRKGFTCQLFNMRGGYGFSAGKEELDLASKFHKKADALEEKGYHRFGAAVRELAKGYERDAARESRTDPFEDL